MKSDSQEQLDILAYLRNSQQRIMSLALMDNPENWIHYEPIFREMEELVDYAISSR